MRWLRRCGQQLRQADWDHDDDRDGNVERD